MLQAKMPLRGPVAARTVFSFTALVTVKGQFGFAKIAGQLKVARSSLGTAVGGGAAHLGSFAQGDGFATVGTGGGPWVVGALVLYDKDRACGDGCVFAVGRLGGCIAHRGIIPQRSLNGGNAWATHSQG